MASTSGLRRSDGSDVSSASLSSSSVSDSRDYDGANTYAAAAASGSVRGSTSNSNGGGSNIDDNDEDDRSGDEDDDDGGAGYDDGDVSDDDEDDYELDDVGGTIDATMSATESEHLRLFCNKFVEIKASLGRLAAERAKLTATRRAAEAVLMGHMERHSVTCVPIEFDTRLGKPYYLRTVNTACQSNVSAKRIGDALIRLTLPAPPSDTNDASAPAASTTTPAASTTTTPAIGLEIVRRAAVRLRSTLKRDPTLAEVLAESVVASTNATCSYRRKAVRIVDSRERVVKDPATAAADAAKKKKRSARTRAAAASKRRRGVITSAGGNGADDDDDDSEDDDETPQPAPAGSSHALDTEARGWALEHHRVSAALTEANKQTRELNAQLRAMTADLAPTSSALTAAIKASSSSANGGVGVAAVDEVEDDAELHAVAAAVHAAAASALPQRKTPPKPKAGTAAAAAASAAATTAAATTAAAATTPTVPGTRPPSKSQLAAQERKRVMHGQFSEARDVISGYLARANPNKRVTKIEINDRSIPTSYRVCEKQCGTTPQLTDAQYRTLAARAVVLALRAAGESVAAPYSEDVAGRALASDALRTAVQNALVTSITETRKRGMVKTRIITLNRIANPASKHARADAIALRANRISSADALIPPTAMVVDDAARGGGDDDDDGDDASRSVTSRSEYGDSDDAVSVIGGGGGDGGGGDGGGGGDRRSDDDDDASSVASRQSRDGVSDDSDSVFSSDSGDDRDSRAGGGGGGGNGFHHPQQQADSGQRR